jgi:aryl carrier-like protein
MTQGALLRARRFAPFFWTQFLGAFNDNLFELGADSLHVFQIVARANKAGIGVKPRQILQFRTIAAVSAELAKSPSGASQAPPLAPVSRSRYRFVR